MTVCERCIWYGQCYTYKDCEYFSPITENIDDLIEEGRTLFLEDWNEYVMDD